MAVIVIENLVVDIANLESQRIEKREEENRGEK